MIPNIIDVETSGFGHSSFPIVIGFILGNGEKYSRLICPEAEWHHWCVEAEKVHHISRELLVQRGCSVLTVATELNQLLLNKTVYSDGWVVDKPWVWKLFRQQELLFYFQLVHWNLL